jgi:hypothetical protein
MSHSHKYSGGLYCLVGTQLIFSFPETCDAMNAFDVELLETL